MVTIGRLSTKLWLWSWWFPSLYTIGPIPSGAWVQPSVTNDHHLWSLHKGNLWRSPQLTLQIDPMDIFAPFFHKNILLRSINFTFQLVYALLFLRSLGNIAVALETVKYFSRWTIHGMIRALVHGWWLLLCLCYGRFQYVFYILDYS